MTFRAQKSVDCTKYNCPEFWLAVTGLVGFVVFWTRYGAVGAPKEKTEVRFVSHIENVLVLDRSPVIEKPDAAPQQSNLLSGRGTIRREINAIGRFSGNRENAWLRLEWRISKICYRLRSITHTICDLRFESDSPARVDDCCGHGYRFANFELFDGRGHCDQPGSLHNSGYSVATPGTGGSIFTSSVIVHAVMARTVQPVPICKRVETKFRLVSDIEDIVVKDRAEDTNGVAPCLNSG